MGNRGDSQFLINVLNLIFFQAQSDDEDGGADDVPVSMEGRDGGFMEEFFSEVMLCFIVQLS